MLNRYRGHVQSHTCGNYGFQSNSSTGVDNGLYLDHVNNQGQISYDTIYMPAVLAGGQTQIQVREFTKRWRDVHENDDWRCLVGTRHHRVEDFQISN